jgi:hypothetical protein
MYDIEKDGYFLKMKPTFDCKQIRIEFGELDNIKGTVIHVVGDTIEDALLSMVRMNIQQFKEEKSMRQTIETIYVSTGNKLNKSL